MHHKPLFIGLIVLFLSSTIVFAEKDYIPLQGDVYDGGVALASGDLKVYIYSAGGGGSPVYNSSTDFDGAIVNGAFDILLGNKSVELSLVSNQRYYMDIEIDGVDIDFNGAERKPFQAPVGSAGLIVGANSLNGSAIFELNSTTKGMLTPRMTATQRDGISNPASGLLIYNKDDNVFNLYNGSQWTNVSSAAKTDNATHADTASSISGDVLNGGLTLNDDLNLNNNAIINTTTIREVSKSGLIIDLPFDNSSYVNSTVILDSSRHHRNGTVYGDIEFNETGGYDGGGAYEFDNTDDYINLGNDPIFNSYPKTIVAWIYPLEINWGDIVTKRSPGESVLSPDWGVFLHPTAGIMAISGEGVEATDNTIKANEWSQVVVTFDSDATPRIYKNGVYVSVGSGDPTVGVGNVTIGGPRCDSDQTFFNGTIDDVKIYNRMLSADEIKSLYEQRIKSDQPVVYRQSNTEQDIYSDIVIKGDLEVTGGITGSVANSTHANTATALIGGAVTPNATHADTASSAYDLSGTDIIGGTEIDESSLGIVPNATHSDTSSIAYDISGTDVISGINIDESSLSTVPNATHSDSASSISGDKLSSSLTIDGNLIINQNLTVLGDRFNATVTNQFLNGSFIPQLNATFDLGSSSYHWDNVFADVLYGTLVGIAQNATHADTASIAYSVVGTDVLTGTQIDESSLTTVPNATHADTASSAYDLSGTDIIGGTEIDESSLGIVPNATHADTASGISGASNLDLDSTDDLVDSDFGSAGLMKTDGAGSYSLITDSSTNWDLAHTSVTNNTFYLASNPDSFLVVTDKINNATHSNTATTAYDVSGSDVLTGTEIDESSLGIVPNATHSNTASIAYDLSCTDCIGGTEIAELTDADISNTLTASILSPAATTDLGNYQLVNIGDANTDFNSTGGLNLATGLGFTAGGINSVSAITFSNDAVNHRISDNATCITLTGDTATLSVC